ncbi:MAG TPA: polyprenyl diphosphate synthase [Thermoanaerobaculia bacterium]|nr:polyprenyl diphosphate synthase [Thermoanaerobaculia bacterium]
MSKPALHLAIIMDGNGRWAEERGWARSRGHRAGADAVQRVVRAAQDLGIGTVTLYAFSADNWSRPEGEVRVLMTLFRRFLRTRVGTCRRDGVRLSVIGRRDRLPDVLVTSIEQAEEATREGGRVHLRLAVDYSSRDAMLLAARWAAGRQLSRDAFGELLARAHHGEATTPDVDLLIRTGREKRLSDFLLWECAYAELYFTDRLWPDFTGEDLEAAMAEFRKRDRRFGRLPNRSSDETTFAVTPAAASIEDFGRGAERQSGVAIVNRFDSTVSAR